MRRLPLFVSQLSCRSCPSACFSSCTDWNVREYKPSGRTVGRIYQNVSAGGEWFWCFNDRSTSSHRGYAPTRATAMLALKYRWREEMQVETPERMKNHPEYRDIAD